MWQQSNSNSLTLKNEGKITWQHPEVGWIHLSGSCTVCTSALTASEQHWCRCLPLFGSWLFWSRKIPWFSSCLSRPKHIFSHYGTVSCKNASIVISVSPVRIQIHRIQIRIQVFSKGPGTTARFFSVQPIEFRWIKSIFWDQKMLLLIIPAPEEKKLKIFKFQPRN